MNIFSLIDKRTVLIQTVIPFCSRGEVGRYMTYEAMCNVCEIVCFNLIHKGRRLSFDIAFMYGGHASRSAVVVQVGIAVWRLVIPDNRVREHG